MSFGSGASSGCPMDEPACSSASRRQVSGPLPESCHLECSQYHLFLAAGLTPRSRARRTAEQLHLTKRVTFRDNIVRPRTTAAASSCRPCGLPPAQLPSTSTSSRTELAGLRKMPGLECAGGGVALCEGQTPGAPTVSAGIEWRLLPDVHHAIPPAERYAAHVADRNVPAWTLDKFFCSQKHRQLVPRQTASQGG